MQTLSGQYLNVRRFPSRVTLAFITQLPMYGLSPLMGVIRRLDIDDDPPSGVLGVSAFFPDSGDATRRVVSFVS